MLALLRRRGGFRGGMVGVDYSARSVELARELQRLKCHSAYLMDEDDVDVDVDEEEIRFEEWDILASVGGLEEGGLDWFPYERGGFDIVLDKGTFDAVSLSEEEVVVEEGGGSVGGKKVVRRVCERYPGIVRGLVRKGGFLVVTSCNWTEEELISWFTREKGGDCLEVWGRVQYPRFRFGGKEGQGVCTVCFQRV
ncbi:hypothetical protein BDV28DRAFT_161647 [Aspergillus coremiiformis]|uniref:Methyltransferase domain-containing protein n=1 Tax=Aspergillus coremiiformis TaxID=138285 RepID=A0A5N6YRN5_9EURO|nr:hypothetical protein BDV28DRAFT_161647 [Aspergillus coremiiformis]